MCVYCNGDEVTCEVFVEPLTNEYYLKAEYENVYGISFCPYCGRSLYEQNDKSKIVLAIKDITDIVEWANVK